MKPIRVLTPDLSILAEIDSYESLIFTRQWHKPGEFELRINWHKRNTDKLQKGNLILLGGDTSKVGVIKHREIGLDESGKASEQWTIKGIALSGVTSQRITIPPAGQAYDSITAPAETVMKHYVNTNLVNPADINRKIDLLTIATDQGRGQSLTWQSRYKGLGDELEAISIASGLGWKVYLDFDLMKWVFEVYEGRNLTTGQSLLPPVIFSPDFDNLKSQHFAESDYNYRNYAYVGGQGEGATRTIQSVGTDTGLSRIETFVDARDLTTTADLTARGEQKLTEMDVQQTLEAEIITPVQQVAYERTYFFLSPAQVLEESKRKLIYTSGTFKYEIDYDLGDIVTIQNKSWGITMDARITELKEIFEPGGFRLEATFGNSRPTLITKLKQELSQFGAEIRK